MKKLLLLLAVVPSFSLMLRPGIYSMHDFHVFRQQQFDKCLKAGYFPCRWAADAALGYGQPLFNYYGQLPYWVGEVFVLLGFQIIDSVKINFILTLSLSVVSIYFLARQFWDRSGAVVSAVFYVYAPYRAVDVWVRGALNEAYAFVFFPLILLHFDQYLLRRKNASLFWLVIFSSALLVTHNLSFIMFAPFLAAWFFYRAWQKKFRLPYSNLASSALLVLLLSAFYLLPVIFESRLVNLSQTTAGYFNFRHHFVSLNQLFVSRLWGYGGSVWGPNDTMSFSVGHLHWIMAIVIGVVILAKRQLKRPFATSYMLFALLAALALFLTHGKSEFIWNALPPMANIQFPWRFMAVSVFFLSLAAGALPAVVSQKLWLAGVLTLLLLLNAGYFKPDIWRSISDSEQFSGRLWDEQRSSAPSDFWPRTASRLPRSFAPSQPRILLDTTEYQKIQYPIVYFPGWKSRTELFPSGPLGLITARVPAGTQPTLKFTDTPVRRLGNLVSLLALAGLLIWKLKYARG